MIYRFRIEKLYDGKASVRDYIVEHCINNKIPLKIILGEEFMILRGNELSNFTCDGRTFVARVDDQFIKKGSIYRLYDFHFIPTVISRKPEVPEQGWTSEGREKLLQAFKSSKIKQNAIFQK